VFKHYRTKFKWLLDSHDETLKLSPFDEPLALRNFLTSISAKTRSLKVYAPSDVVSSNMDVVRSMIENCQWKGHRLNVSTTEDVKASQTVLQTLSEKIWRCLRSPTSSSRKIEIIEELIDVNVDPLSNKSIMSNLYSMSRSERSLSFIIKAVKYSKVGLQYSNILPILEFLKMGVIGSFVIRQPFENGLYIGKGLFSGKFDGHRCNIHLHDSTVSKLVISSKESLSLFSDTLYDFIKSMGWKSDLIRAGSRWNFIKRAVSHKASPRSYIIETIGPMTVLPVYDSKSIFLELTNYNCLRVRCEDSHKRLMTLLSHKIQVRDLGSNSKHDMPPRPNEVDYWISSSPYPIEDLVKKINTVEFFAEWSADCLTKRIVGRGFLPDVSDVFSTEEPQEEAPEVDVDFSMFYSARYDGFDKSSFLDEDQMEPGEMEIGGLDSTRIVEMDEAFKEQVSWFDYRMLPFSPAASVDCAYTNLFFDGLIDDIRGFLGMEAFSAIFERMNNRDRSSRQIRDILKKLYESKALLHSLGF